MSKAKQILDHLVAQAKLDHADLLVGINEDIIATLIAHGFTAGVQHYRNHAESLEFCETQLYVVQSPSADGEQVADEPILSKKAKVKSVSDNPNIGFRDRINQRNIDSRNDAEQDPFLHPLNKGD